MKASYATRLENALLPYRRYWDDWIISDYCSLTQGELQALNYYSSSKSFDDLARAINRKRETARTLIRRIINKLRSSQTIYQDWAARHQGGTERNEDYPLHVPVVCLPVSIRLKRCLHSTGETLHEALSACTDGELYKMKGFGKGMMEELESFLERNGYRLDELLTTVQQETKDELHTTLLPTPASIVPVKYSRFRTVKPGTVRRIRK